MQIRKAERRKAKLRLAIAGSSGSGKTWSALEIATGMGGKIGLIDTEAGRGELYGNNFEYDIIRLEAPYSPQRYIQAIKEFEKAGYDILIVDSLSHAWSGEGGVLSIVENAGGSFQAGWKKGTPQQNSLIDAITTSKMHIIATMRVKTEYVVEQNEKGKSAPKKVGLAPVQRDQIEYEFTMFMSINQEHMAHVMKDNTGMYDQEFVKPSKELGEKLMEWLNSGAEQIEVKPKVEKPKEKPVGDYDQATYDIDHTESLEGLSNIWAEINKFLFSNENLKSLINLKDTRKAELAAEKMRQMAAFAAEHDPQNLAEQVIDENNGEQE